MSGSLLYSPAFIPKRVGGILKLLDSMDADDEFTPEQEAAIRRILHLDDPRTVAELMTAGEIPIPITGGKP